MAEQFERPCFTYSALSYEVFSVTWLRWFLAGVSAEPGLNPTLIDLGFVVDIVEMGQVFLAVLLLFPVSIIRATVHARYYICHRQNIIIAFDSIVKQHTKNLFFFVYYREADAMYTILHHTEQVVVKGDGCYLRQVPGSSLSPDTPCSESWISRDFPPFLRTYRNGTSG